MGKLLGLVPRHAIVAARVGASQGTLGEALRDAAVRHTRGHRESGGMFSSMYGVLLYLGVVPLMGLR